MSKFLILSALLFGSALAQTTTAPSTTPVSVPGTVPASVQSDLAALKTFLASGGRIELLGISGTVVGTLNADGTVMLTGTSTLTDVASVRATAPNGTATTYTLGRDLSKPGAIKLQWTQSNGKVASLPLSAIVNRASKSAATTTTDSAKVQAAKAKAEAKARAEAENARAKAEAEQTKADADEAREQEKAAKSERPTKPERPNNKN
ncbi:hypothetical protein DEDE109153_06955 [Deinococcus deserti]|uniref:Uncharacterized protein n=1 Tax=Deinococcus deserti (strain DSM 17065 / CIP 109153 / LMG 22923 / VCD115) TaxID=546414 RepID=C1CWS6_DEIDV|nr:hypothetical protein [Deinococcus deserti]ACO46643.1 Hypothetical protein, precursor [Deinococcus deserti VCD115]